MTLDSYVLSKSIWSPTGAAVAPVAVVVCAAVYAADVDTRCSMCFAVSASFSYSGFTFDAAAANNGSRSTCDDACAVGACGAVGGMIAVWNHRHSWVR